MPKLEQALEKARQGGRITDAEALGLASWEDTRALAEVAANAAR